MSWARIDDKSAFHMKVLFVGNGAWGALCRMIAHSCSENTDGFIAKVTAHTIASKAEMARLLAPPPGGKSPMLLPETDGYRIHDFHEWNPFARDVIAQRKAEAERKAAGRSRQARGADGRITSDRSPPSSSVVRADVRADNTTDVRADGDPDNQPDNGGTAGGTPPGVPPVPIPIPVPILPEGDPPNPPAGGPAAEGGDSGVFAAAPRAVDPEPSTRPLDPGVARFEMPDWIVAYRRGIERGSGGSFTSGFRALEREALERVVGDPTRCTDRSRMSEWIEREAERFARAVKAKPKVWSGYSPIGFESWFNSHCPTEAAPGPLRGLARPPVQAFTPPPSGTVACPRSEPELLSFEEHLDQFFPADAVGDGA